MKILVRNLDRTTTAEELKPLFEQFGAVESCTLVMDEATNESKGFGFVEMPNVTEAKQAIHNLNNRTFARNRIKVKHAQQK